jgi:hypothetical protein
MDSDTSEVVFMLRDSFSEGGVYLTRTIGLLLGVFALLAAVTALS